MTITFPWWLLPIACVAIGLVSAAIFGRKRGDYDFASAWIGLGCVLLGVVSALGIIIGKLLA